MLSYCQMIWLKLKPLKCFCTELYVRLLPTEEPFKKKSLEKVQKFLRGILFLKKSSLINELH